MKNIKEKIENVVATAIIGTLFLAPIGFVVYSIFDRPEPTAVCRDNTYSYSQSRQGTCSWHGGVKIWL